MDGSIRRKNIVIGTCMSSLRFGMTKEIVGKVGEVSKKTRKGLVAGAGHIGEIHPRVVLARVSAGSADSGSG